MGGGVWCRRDGLGGGRCAGSAGGWWRVRGLGGCRLRCRCWRGGGLVEGKRGGGGLGASFGGSKGGCLGGGLVGG